MDSERLVELGERVLQLAKQFGAAQADTVVQYGTDFEVKVADGEIVTLTQATAKGLGLRVFVDQRMGFCATSDFTKHGLEQIVERCVMLAREASPDPFNGLPDDLPPGRMDAGPDLDLYDPKMAQLSTDEKIRWAHALEQAARAADPRVTRFRDSGVASGESEAALITSNGAVRTMRSTGISLWCNPLARDPGTGELQTEVWYDSKTHLEDLESVESIGRRAGLRAARMLGARPVPTQHVPVIFEPSMAAGFVAGILGAIDGDMVFKKASFLADKLGAVIAAPELNVIDDPLLPRGSGSTPFDGEGLPTTRKAILDRGRLTTFLYDSYTARKAGVRPTANARRGYASLPSAGPFNFYVQPGTVDPKTLCNVPRALFVTRGLGRGVNTVSGEYSRGANGLWIEHGEVVHAVQEVTIAGQFIDLLKGIDAIGTDLEMRGSVGAPTLRIAEMVMSGKAS